MPGSGLCCCALSLAGAATSIIFVATKHVFCRDKSMLAATKHLLRETIFLSRQNFCHDKYLSRQTYTSILLSRQRTCSVSNTCLSRHRRSVPELPDVSLVTTSAVHVPKSSLTRTTDIRPDDHRLSGSFPTIPSSGGWSLPAGATDVRCVCVCK